MNNVVYVSAHDENGGIYQISLTDDNSGSIEKIVNNGASICNKVHSLTMYSDIVFAFSDTGNLSIKVYNVSEQTCSVVVGNGEGTKDGSKAQLSQPTGIYFDFDTLFTLDTSTGALHMTSSVKSLVNWSI